MHSVVPIGVDVQVILAPPCMFCMENHQYNMQAGIRMTLTPMASRAVRVVLPHALFRQLTGRQCAADEPRNVAWEKQVLSARGSSG
jgi:hypothetical protein